jgi:endonuclease/exonuclease/phosphatase family metal-dependent hydrolase
MKTGKFNIYKEGQHMRKAEITVLTYNVKNCQGGTKISEIAAEIADTGAQIVFMQEVDCKTKRSAGKDEAKGIAQALGFDYAFLPIMEYDGGLYGNAIFSAFPLSGAACTSLPVPGKMEPRALGQADITVEGTPVRLFVTHLSYEDTFTRAEQFARVSEALASAPGGSFLLGGDFNTASYGEYALLPGAVPAHSAPVPGIRRIDNIFCDPAKALRNTRSVPTGYSDHDLVLAELMF